MDGCEYSVEVIIVPLKERMRETNFFLEINISGIAQTMDDCKISCQNNTVSFKEWMIAILSVTKTDTLLQEMNDCEITVKLEW